MGYHPDFEHDGPFMRPVWEYAHEKETVLSIDMGTFDQRSMQIDRLAKAAKEYPGVRIVLEHLFFPSRDHYTKTARDQFIQRINLHITMIQNITPLRFRSRTGAKYSPPCPGEPRL